MECACAPIIGRVTNDTDCDDDRADSNPDGTELCDGADNDCDESIDKPGTTDCTNYFVDGDGDGYGTGTPLCACDPTGLYTAPLGGDCDEIICGADCHPGADELCDGIDNDCEAGTVETEDGVAADCVVYYSDVDGDGFGSALSRCLCDPAAPYDTITGNDCDDGTAVTDCGSHCHPGAPSFATASPTTAA